MLIKHPTREENSANETLTGVFDPLGGKMGTGEEIHGMPSLLGARTLLGAPGLTTRNNKLLGAKGIATRSKDATRGSWPYY